MPKTIVVCGYGPGSSQAVARKFGAEGFQVALVARNASKLEEAARSLESAGVKAKAFACDLSDGSAIAPLAARVRESFGAITVVHWNPFASIAGDLTRADVSEMKTLFDLGVNNLITLVQLALPDLRASKDSPAILVTGGGFALYNPQIDELAAKGAMGLAIMKAAQHKLTGVLHHKLKSEGIYVGEVTVLGLVKGTAHDRGNATIEPSAVADKFWALYQTRTESWVNVG